MHQKLNPEYLKVVDEVGAGDISNHVIEIWPGNKNSNRGPNAIWGQMQL